jgi:hypothetical protein
MLITYLGRRFRVPSPIRVLSPKSKFLKESHGLRFIVYFTKISPKE